MIDSDSDSDIEVEILRRCCICHKSKKICENIQKIQKKNFTKVAILAELVQENEARLIDEKRECR